MHWDCDVATFQIHKAKYFFEVHIAEYWKMLLNIKATSKYWVIVSLQVSSEIFTKYKI